MLTVGTVGSQKVLCLCLLDLSSDFNPIKYNILITRLSSWFDIYGSVLNQLVHVLFITSLDPSVLNMATKTLVFAFSSCGVPQGFVLGALYFSLCMLRCYPTQNSHLFAFHWPPPLCRWNSALLLLPTTQLWLKHCSPSKALQQISSWMTANFLTLNSSKTELLLIGLKKTTCQNKQLFPYHLPLAASSLTNIWPSQTKPYLTPKPGTIIFVKLRGIQPYLDSSTACTIATSTVHSKFDCHITPILR